MKPFKHPNVKKHSKNNTAISFRLNVKFVCYKFFLLAF